MVMHLGPNSDYQYSVGDSEILSSVNEIRDLGIWTDTSMSFSLQCQKASNKAMQALGQLKELLSTFLSNLFQFYTKRTLDHI